MTKLTLLLALLFALFNPTFGKVSGKHGKMMKGGKKHGTPKTIKIQELQAPNGPNHSAGIVYAPSDGTPNDGTSVGFVYFSNHLVVPDTGGFDGTPMGTQTGH
jgi:hypothetical protein